MLARNRNQRPGSSVEGKEDSCEACPKTGKHGNIQIDDGFIYVTPRTCYLSCEHFTPASLPKLLAQRPQSPFLISPAGAAGV